MRLHRLEMCAFGPYADAATVDFDALAADGLFLLHGPTGAGKTTVLDAIAYALFGRVPGARQQAGRLRCDYADAAAAPRVSLELTLGERRLRVVRTPEWQRPKLRGTGTTRENASATLEEHGAGGWQALSTRIDEVSDQLHQWLGMSAEQFFQVVLLPQGEFARFLRAESTDREELLERLFGTRRFGDVESWLAGRRQETRRLVAAAEERIRSLLARLCQAAGVAEEPALESVDAGWVAGLTTRADRAGAAAAAVCAAAEQALAEAVTEHGQVAELRRRQERRLAAEELRAKIDAARDEQEARRAEMDQARRAAPVRPLLRNVAAARAEAAECATRLARVGPADLAPPEALQARADQQRAEAAVLCAARADEAALPAAESAVDAAAGQVAALRGEAQRHAVTIATLPARIEELRAQLSEAQRAADRLAPVTAESVAAQTALCAAREHVALAENVTALRGALLAAAEAHHRARELVLELRERRLDGYAAELAAVLRPGEPCGVCGGLDHPRPAQPAGGEQVTDAAEAAARAGEDTARARRETAEAALATAERELTRLVTVTGGRTVQEIAAQTSALADALERLTAQAAGLEHARAALDAAEAQLRAGAAEDRRLAAAIAAAESEHEQRCAALDVLRRRLDAARGDDASIADRIARLTGLADQASAVRELLLTEAGVRAAVAAAERAADEEAARAGFEDTDAAAAAWLDDGALAELEAQCREWSDRDAAAAAALADPELAALEPFAAPVDVDPVAESLERARDAHAAALAAARQAEHRLAQVAAAADALTRALSDAAPARARHDHVAALADLVAGQGQNVRRMTLRAYVLASRLDEVARCASQRLRRMSAGRYSFVFTGDADSRRVRAGLNLRVLDDYSGQARSTRTLSGGESFLASLALALGLADVVSAEAGGTQLDTLFIDEGFGSLDADTLDLVMDTLDELRAGGRVIGVVSHVAEMRQRIPMRLRVRKVGVTSRIELETG